MECPDVKMGAPTLLVFLVRGCYGPVGAVWSVSIEVGPGSVFFFVGSLCRDLSVKPLERLSSLCGFALDVLVMSFVGCAMMT